MPAGKASPWVGTGDKLCETSECGFRSALGTRTFIWQRNRHESCLFWLRNDQAAYRTQPSAVGVQAHRGLTE